MVAEGMVKRISRAMREIQVYLGPKFIVPQHNMKSLVPLVRYTGAYNPPSIRICLISI